MRSGSERLTAASVTGELRPKTNIGFDIGQRTPIPFVSVLCIACQAKTRALTRYLPTKPPRVARDGIIAGVTLAAYAIPMALAYATLAGLPPQVGILCNSAGGKTSNRHSKYS
jgi:hypothetical protein